LTKSDNVDDQTWKVIAEEVHRDADRLFKIIGEAYAVLSDPAKVFYIFSTNHVAERLSLYIVRRLVFCGIVSINPRGQSHLVVLGFVLDTWHHVI